MTDDDIQRRLNWTDGDQQHQGEESDILRQQRRVVILKEPGMSKTERLKRLGNNKNTVRTRVSIPAVDERTGICRAACR